MSNAAVPVYFTRILHCLRKNDKKWLTSYRKMVKNFSNLSLTFKCHNWEARVIKAGKTCTALFSISVLHFCQIFLLSAPLLLNRTLFYTAIMQLLTNGNITNSLCDSLYILYFRSIWRKCKIPFKDVLRITNELRRRYTPREAQTFASRRDRSARYLRQTRTCD